MKSAIINNECGPAKLQSAVRLLQDGLADVLQKSYSLNKPLDLKEGLQMVRDHAGEFAPDLTVQKELLGALDRADDVVSRICQQEFDACRCEHDMECLLKLASLMGLHEFRAIASEHTGTAAASEGWEKLKAEGNEHYKSGRWAEAMDCYTKAIRVNAKVPVLYSNRALCEMQLAKFDLAREDAEDAIDLDPKQVKFYRILSDALFRLELFQEALSACEDGLNLDPRDEILVSRARGCKAAIVHKEIKMHPKAGGFESVRDSRVRNNILDTMLKKASESEISADEIGLVDATTMQTIKKIREAHLILQSCRGNAREEQKAFKIFEAAAKRGSAEGLYNMALMYYDGQAGLTRDPKKCYDLCRKAAEQKPYLKFKAAGLIHANIGVAEAENSIAMAFRDGLIVKQDEKLAFQWFLKSAKHGCPSAMNNLGRAYYNGYGCEKSLESARFWYQKSADLGQSEAQFNLAFLLENCEGGPADIPKAAELLKSAADQGLPGALIALQQLMRSGANGSKSMEAPKKIVQRRADSNEKEALYLIGMNYLLGEGGFAKDMSEAEKYLRKASKLNHNGATVALGEILLKQNRNEDAIPFIWKAAEDGDKDAQRTLGKLLALGHGCGRDETQARRWLLRSKMSKDDVDEFIKYSAAVNDFEAAEGLEQCGIQMFERIERFATSFVPAQEDKKDINAIFKLLGPKNSRHPACAPMSYSTLEHKMQLMAQKALEGSKTAQSLFIAIDLIKQASSALDSQNPSEAFRLFREANRAWQPLPMDLETWDRLFAAAKEAIERNPKHADALFVMVHCNTVKKLCSLPELQRMALKCTILNPDVADYHTLLGCMYAFNCDYESALKSIERGLALEWEPEWLYDKASAMRLRDVREHQKVIDIYEEYLSSCEPDSRHVPKALYSIADEYFAMNDIENARKFFNKGLRAESPDLRLPFFEPVDDFPPKMLLKIQLDAEARKSSVLKARTSSATSAAFQSGQGQCANCNKAGASSRCSKCKKAFYCNRDCQLNHWKVHKKQCAV